tara:strand:+ start:1238 stop:1870 length:633 start_codon:yes stop_codon:yes gene_type:complete
MSEVKLTADSGGGTVAWKAPASTTSNAAVTLTLPQNDGDADQVLATNGSGTLSWADAGGGKVLQYVHVQSTGSNYFDADNAFQDIGNTTITVTTTKLNSKILIQWNSGIAQEASSGNTSEISFRVRRSIGGVDVDVREDNQWSYYATSTSWLGPGQFHMMHLDSPAQSASTAVQYKLMGLVQNSTGKIWLPYSESGATNNMQIVAMELDV